MESPRLLENYLEESRRVVFFARIEAGRTGSSSIELEHVLRAMLQEAPYLFRRICPEVPDLVERLQRGLEPLTARRPAVPAQMEMPLSDPAISALSKAGDEAAGIGHGFIGVEHLLLAILRQSETEVAKLLIAHGITREKVLPLIRIRGQDRIQAEAAEPASAARPLFQTFGGAARGIIISAREEAVRAGASFLEPHHLFQALLSRERSLVESFRPGDSGFVAELRRAVESEFFPRDPLPESTDIPLSTASKRIFSTAITEAMRRGRTQVEPIGLLLGIVLQSGSRIAALLAGQGLTMDAVTRRAEEES